MSFERYLPDLLRSRYSVKLLGVSLLIVLVVVAIGVTTAIQVSDQAAEEQLESVEANAELEAEALGKWIEGEQESIRVLANHGSIDPNDIDSTRETLETELDTMDEEAAALHLAERSPERLSNGTTEQVVASTEPELEGNELAETNINWGEDVDGDDRQYNFEDEDDVILSWVYMDKDESSVAVASPTADGEYVLISEYRTSVRAEEFTSVIKETETVVLGGVSAYVVFDEDNPDEFKEYSGDRESTEIGQTILENDDPFAVLSGSVLTDEEVKGYHSVPADDVDWVVVKEAPRSNAFALADQIRADLAMLIGTVILGFLLIGIVIQRGPIRSIRRLAWQADSIAEGDLTVEIEDEGRIDEVGEVRESFQKTKEYIETITRQSEALSEQRFDAAVLDEEIPGAVGTSMATMRADLERYIDALEHERKRYSTLVEQSSDGVVVIQDGEIVFANEQFAKIVGADSNALPGMPIVDLIAPEDRQLARERHEKRMQGASPPDRYEIDIETNAGERRTVEVAISRIDHDNEPAALINVRDVTERNRREQRLDVLNRVLRHNLRNDLEVIGGVLESIDTSSTHDPEMLAVARRQTSELLETAETARRMEHALEDVEIIQHDLQAVLDSLAEQSRSEFSVARLTVDTEAVTVSAVDVLDEALWELLENAFQHTESSQVTISVDVHDRMATVSLGDGGPGIPDDVYKSIERGEETALAHGDGLGLWFAYWMIEASGGDLAFEVDEGTTVRVRLPLAD